LGDFIFFRDGEVKELSRFISFIPPNGGGEWTTFDLTAGGLTYPIHYRITGGSVEDMTIHGENQTLGITLDSTSNGALALRLPREIIDSQTAEGEDADFVAFIDNAEYSEPSEIEPTEDTRTVLIGFQHVLSKLML
jgi:hypothetical protein